MRHCELFGFSISKGECKDTINKDFFECQNCVEEGVVMAIKPEIKAEAICSVCGKKATKDKNFRFKRSMCCACVAREDRVKKAGEHPRTTTPLSPPKIEGEPVPVNTERKITIDLWEHPELFEQLIKLAEAEIRSLDNLVIYFLKKGDFSGLSSRAI